MNIEYINFVIDKVFGNLNQTKKEIDNPAQEFPDEKICLSEEEIDWDKVANIIYSKPKSNKSLLNINIDNINNYQVISKGEPQNGDY